MAEDEQDLTNLWNEILDCISEVEGDLKGSRRGLRHVKNLKQAVTELDDVFKSMATNKKGFLRR